MSLISPIDTMHLSSLACACQPKDRADAPVISHPTDTNTCPRIEFVIGEVEVLMFLHIYTVGKRNLHFLQSEKKHLLDI